MEMSQDHNSRDNQALLQSMLQRLKLQGGTINIPSEQNSTGGQNLHSETVGLQTANSNNGFEQTDKIKREFTVSGKLQDLDLSSEKNGALGHSQEHGQRSQSGLQFSPKSAYAAAPISSEGSINLSNSETKDISQGQHTEQKQDQDSGFVPKVYTWATQNTETQKDNVTFGGVFGATGVNTQTVTNNQNTTNNRKQRSSENKTRKWTQKIKEKWRDRPGSFGKKDRFADKTTQENSLQYQPPTQFNLSLKEETGGTLTHEDRTDHLQIQMANGNESMRSTNDFDLGLGSFSLLDEIVSGQEWAKFLNPATSALIHEGPSQETKYYDGKSKMNLMLSERDVGTKSHIFGTSGQTANTDIAMTQVSLEPPLHIGMDITDKTHIQTEPMDHGQSHSDMQVTGSDEQPQHQHTIKTELTNIVDNSSLRNSLGRKRQHQSSESIVTKFSRVGTNGNVSVDDGSVFLPANHAMDNADGRLMCVFSSTTKPVPPGVLKSTLSCSSANSMETVSKKRRMEVTRHVRFSEEIIAIDPPELGSYMSESEEESEEEEDSFLEDDSVEQAEPTPLGPDRPEEAVPARRRALPAWIRALKRKNTGKKPR